MRPAPFPLLVISYFSVSGADICRLSQISVINRRDAVRFVVFQVPASGDKSIGIGAFGVS